MDVLNSLILGEQRLRIGLRVEKINFTSHDFAGKFAMSQITYDHDIFCM